MRIAAVLRRGPFGRFWAVPLSIGRLICLAQVLAGVGLGVALFGRSIGSIAPALFLVGFFSAPLSAWAQTLRMRVIPPPLRGRSFALLRTMMQSSTRVRELVIAD